MKEKTPENSVKTDIDKIVEFWINSSDRDFQTMNSMFEKKEYNWSLFIGHLVIEKLLKAYYVKTIGTHAPLIHNLLKIAMDSKLEFDEEKRIFFITVTAFNINARYDDYKTNFYKKCTKKFTEEWVNKITENREWIKKQLNW